MYAVTNYHHLYKSCETNCLGGGPPLLDKFKVINYFYRSESKGPGPKGPETKEPAV